MRKHTVSFVGLLAVLAAAVGLTVVGVAGAAHGEGPVTVKVGELELTADGGFFPKALPKKSLRPVGVTAAGKVREVDGSHPPAVRQVLLEIDRHATVNTKGLPVCRSGRLQATDTRAALKACKKALIGTGQTTAQVAFAEQKPIDVPSKLLVFNGGDKGGKVKMFIHAFFSTPISGAIVTTVTFKKIHHGRFGLLAEAKIPQITGGSGSITSFNLNISKWFRHNGHKTRAFSAQCADGKLKVHVLAKFEDGTKAETEIVRACRSKG
jgi:hypothetical protein